MTTQSITLIVTQQQARFRHILRLFPNRILQHSQKLTLQFNQVIRFAIQTKHLKHPRIRSSRWKG
ncbi:hypothetical protein N7501_007567 [Penicillium viridicatum]|nr:hypothetical protein N7501_007567 [Penicillium viridicatum]